MFVHPDFDPVALQLGPLQIRWYGLMYLLGFAIAWWLGRRRARTTPGWTVQQVDDLVFFSALGVILGGRLGYMLFYKFGDILAEPLSMLRIWEGGMSFHGGLIGVLLTMVLLARKTDKRFFQVTDFLAPLIPPGLGFGRLGNFINGELWGRPTELPWGMVFPRVDELPRHPSQLYQALLEGLVLFVVLWWFSARPRPRMAVSGLFLLGYGCARLLTELFRQPDAHLGFLALGLTMGQWLSLPMAVAGALLLWWAYRRREGEDHA
jgi:phosphatidylglycerol:prolipoprotein diacylglycerol transferase